MVCDGRCVQGPGTVYRILIHDYQRFRLHGVELQTPIRDYDALYEVRFAREVASCMRHCSTCVAPRQGAMMSRRHPHLPPVYHWQSPLSSRPNRWQQRIRVVPLRT